MQMEIEIKEGDNLPAGKYQLTGREKLENARGNLCYGVSNREFLLEYDRIAGRVLRDGVVLPPQSLWQIEQKHMNRPIEEFTDDELHAIIRRAENSNVPGSLYQKAYNEWQIRNQRATLEMMKNSNKQTSFVNIESGAEVSGLTMRDNTFVGEGKFLNNKGKLEDATLEGNQHLAGKTHPEPSILKSGLMQVIIGLLILVLGYLLFGWLGFKW